MNNAHFDHTNPDQPMRVAALGRRQQQQEEQESRENDDDDEEDIQIRQIQLHHHHQQQNVQNQDELDENHLFILGFLIVCLSSICFPFVAMFYPAMVHDVSVLLTLVLLTTAVPGAVLTLEELRYLVCNILYAFNLKMNSKNLRILI